MYLSTQLEAHQEFTSMCGHIQEDITCVIKRIDRIRRMSCVQITIGSAKLTSMHMILE